MSDGDGEQRLELNACKAVLGAQDGSLSFTSTSKLPPGSVKVVDVQRTMLPDPTFVCAFPMDDFDPHVRHADNPLLSFDHCLPPLYVEQDDLLQAVLKDDGLTDDPDLLVSLPSSCNDPL